MTAPQPVLPAGNGKRFVAHLIDSFAWLIAIALVPPSVGLLVLLAWFAFWVVVAAGGMSPGKRVMGLVCLDLGTGRPATLGKMVVRDLLAKSLLSTVALGITGLIGSIQIFGNERRRALWDSMTDTVVLERSSFAPGARPAPAVPSSPQPVPLPVPPAPLTTDLGTAKDPFSMSGHLGGPVDAEAITVPDDVSGLDERTVARTLRVPVPVAEPSVGVAATPVWVLSPSWDVDRSLRGERTVILGRAPDAAADGCEVMRTPAGDSAVSRTHCSLRLGDDAQVEDLGSRNGTLVERPDGSTIALRPHEATVVPSGSQIVLGDHWLVVRRT